MGVKGFQKGHLVSNETRAKISKANNGNFFAICDYCGKEYIERNELIKNLKYFAPEHYSDLINELITKQPAADVEPVKHGHWITDSVEFYKLLNAKGVPLEEQPYLTSDCVACSECMRVINCMDNCMEDALYCKYCGAKMDKENSE